MSVKVDWTAEPSRVERTRVENSAAEHLVFDWSRKTKPYRVPLRGRGKNSANHLDFWVFSVPDGPIVKVPSENRGRLFEWLGCNASLLSSRRFCLSLWFSRRRGANQEHTDLDCSGKRFSEGSLSAKRLGRDGERGLRWGDGGEEETHGSMPPD